MRFSVVPIVTVLFCLMAAGDESNSNSFQSIDADTPNQAVDTAGESTQTVNDGPFCLHPAPISARESLAVVYQQMLALRRQHEDAFQRNNLPVVKELARRILQLETQFRFPVKATLSAEPRVHAVGYYSTLGNIGHVKVADTSSPIVLVLTAYSKVEWAVEADDGVQIDFIMLSGYNGQTISRVPDGVPVFRYAYGTDSNSYAYAYGPDRSKWTEMRKFVARMTGVQSISTIQGRYYAPKEPAIVGPANERWRLQMLEEQFRIIPSGKSEVTEGESAL